MNGESTEEDVKWMWDEEHRAEEGSQKGQSMECEIRTRPKKRIRKGFGIEL